MRELLRGGHLTMLAMAVSKADLSKGPRGTSTLVSLLNCTTHNCSTHTHTLYHKHQLIACPRCLPTGWLSSVMPVAGLTVSACDEEWMKDAHHVELRAALDPVMGSAWVSTDWWLQGPVSGITSTSA
jgi:hypothetical protein